LLNRLFNISNLWGFMSYRLYLLLIFILLLISGCTVNEGTGLITIYNMSSTAVTDIKLNDALLTGSLSAGQKYDYWFFNQIDGAITAGGVKNVLAKFLITDKLNDISYTIFKDDPVCIFKTNYEYHIDIINSGNKVVMYVKEGICKGNNTQYDYPAK